jgi:hypothetical protein
MIIALGVAAAVLLGGFVLAERRAPEPVVPLRLFRSRVFNVANGLGLVIGVVLFGTIVYVPAFFQMAQGASATQAGLRMLPMMAGLLAAAVWAGQRISATGTYKRFPSPAWRWAPPAWRCSVAWVPTPPTRWPLASCWS